MQLLECCWSAAAGELLGSCWGAAGEGGGGGSGGGYSGIRAFGCYEGFGIRGSGAELLLSKPVSNVVKFASAYCMSVSTAFIQG